jgi:hypothetical protein
VFSFNDEAFESMNDAFAGLMTSEAPARAGKTPFRAGASPFQPQRVEQRFDLTGADKIATPLLVDLYERRTRWLDARLADTGSGHNINRYSYRLGTLAADADRYFAAGFRPTMWELACWHAAARADDVVARTAGAGLRTYRRQPGESVTGFASRLLAVGPCEDVDDEQRTPATFAALVRADAALTEAAAVYALYQAGMDANRVQRLAAADLVGLLAPRS